MFSPRALPEDFPKFDLKITFMACIVAMLSSILVGGLYYNRTTEIALNSGKQKLEARTNVLVPAFKATFNQLKSDAFILAHSPSTESYIRTIENKGIDPETGRTTESVLTSANLFYATILQLRPSYTQVRFIGIADKGRELIRVNRGPNSIERVSPEKLQQKAAEPYFVESLSLKPDETYMSAVTLNREHGKPDGTHTVTIRFVVPVFNPRDNLLFGFIVINCDFARLLQESISNNAYANNLILINEAGDYMESVSSPQMSDIHFHEDEDYNPPSIVRAVREVSPMPTASLTHKIKGKEFDVYYTKLPYSSLITKANGFLGIALIEERHKLLATAYTTRDESLILAIFAIIISAILAWPVASALNSHLRKVASQLNTSKSSENKALMQLSAIINNAVDGLITIDHAGIVKSFNPACEKIFGYTSSEVIGKNIKMLMPDKYALHHDGYLQNYQRTHDPKIIGIGREVEGLKKNGDIFPMDLSVAEIRLDGEVFYSGIIRDITERKEAEKRILDSKASESKLLAQLNAIINNAVDGLITIDHTGIVKSFNPACERTFGYASSEVIGKNIKMLMPDKYAVHHDQYLQNYQTTHEPKIIGIGREVEGRRKNGDIFPMDLSVAEVRLNDEVFYSGIIRDITERKHAEQRILDTNTALLKSNAELDDFAYIASHDLKEPLRAIHNHSRFLLEDYASKLEEDGQKRLHRLLEVTLRMEKLIDDLLSFSRLSRSEMAMNNVDMNLVVQDVIKNIESYLEEKNAKVIVPSPLPFAICDRVRVVSILQNLVINGIKYNDNDEKIIEIGFKESQPRNETVERNVFYVKDNGIGIAKEFKDDVFRIFKRLNSPKAYGEGTGAGLTFTKKNIERHGGVIWFESIPGEGTVFYFTLVENKNA